MTLNSLTYILIYIYTIEFPSGPKLECNPILPIIYEFKEKNLIYFSFLYFFSRQATLCDSDEEDSAEVNKQLTSADFVQSPWHNPNNSTTFHNHNSSQQQLISQKNIRFSSNPNLSLLKEDDDVMETNEAPDLNGSTGGSAAGTPGGHELPPLPGFKARLVEGILRSDFVAKMAESEWVKKNITSKNITLQLQLHSVKGTLRANFPPAPSDRIW